MKDVIEKIKSLSNGIMYEIVKLLDELSNGLIRPWHIVSLSFSGYLIIALALSQGIFFKAAILIIGFELLDALGKALSRYQGVSPISILKINPDNIEETIVYASLVYYFTTTSEVIGIIYSSLTIGLLFTQRFVKPIEPIKLSQKNHQQVKQNVHQGTKVNFLGYPTRMLLLITWLLSNQPLYGIAAIASLLVLSLWQYFANISNSS